MAQTGEKSTKAAAARPSAGAKKSTKAAAARPRVVAKKGTSAELKRAAARTADLSEAVLKPVEPGQSPALPAVRLSSTLRCRWQTGSSQRSTTSYAASCAARTAR